VNPPPPEVVTWIKVEKPVFDLFGVFVSSLTFTSLLVLFSLVVGGAFGLLRILRFQRTPPAEADLHLHLETR
jgi:hypothetical protein